jgi:hypothetical protein
MQRRHLRRSLERFELSLRSGAPMSTHPIYEAEAAWNGVITLRLSLQDRHVSINHRWWKLGGPPSAPCNFP